MRPQIVAYYFPNFHADPLNEERHGKGWTEWELLRAAKPRFPGHLQPKIPAWGYGDEADPRVMEQKICAARDAGLAAFLFDWYWYEEGEFLSRCLQEGFLLAKNRGDIAFALMWANHDWTDIHPAKRNGREVQFCGRLSQEKFWEGLKRVVLSYMTQPNYWKLKGKKYFSFYDLGNLVSTFGGKETAREALTEFRKFAAREGVGELHLNAIVYEAPILPGESVRADLDALTAYLGFDSVGSYVWVHHHDLAWPTTDYGTLSDEVAGDYAKFRKKYRLPYLGNVTVGWDSSPRTVGTEGWEEVGYPYCPIVTANTPEKFGKALERLCAEVEADEGGLGVLTVNAWNEWTEGSALEPDLTFGNGYLDAVRRAAMK